MRVSPRMGQFEMSVSGLESLSRANERERIHREPGRGDPRNPRVPDGDREDSLGLSAAMPQVTNQPHQGALKGRKGLTRPDGTNKRPDLSGHMMRTGMSALRSSRVKPMARSANGAFHTSLGQRPRVKEPPIPKPCRGAPFPDRWDGPSALRK